MAIAVPISLDQIKLLPGSSMRVEGLTWPQYRQLLIELGDRRPIRLTYHQGTLEIRMPSKHHELVNRFLERMITTLTEELGLEVIALGSTTLERESLAQGVEPDSCFYIQNASRVTVGIDAPSMEVPPDLVVEVDISSSSKARLKIYAAMGVPEIWLYRPQNFVILQLQASEYVSSEYSLAFPQVSNSFLGSLIERGVQSPDQNAIIRELRQFIQAHDDSP
jgi:Uma2 family endonuclease